MDKAGGRLAHTPIAGILVRTCSSPGLSPADDDDDVGAI